jgi:hypothetical protein
MTPAARTRIRVEKPVKEDAIATFLKRGTNQSTSIN